MVDKVYAVGGTVIQDNLDRINEFAEAFPDEQIAVVTGAGKLNRYQTSVEGNNGKKDLIGIKATRLHAQTLLTAMEEAYPEVPERPVDVQKAAASGQNVVMGGLVPGYSTDAVAATIAELLDAELCIATTVDGVYTDDPEENKDAERFEEMTVEELLDITSGSNEPGIYSVVDEAAVRIIERSKIETKIFKASKENISNPAEAKGTDIIH